VGIAARMVTGGGSLHDRTGLTGLGAHGVKPWRTSDTAERLPPVSMLAARVACQRGNGPTRFAQQPAPLATDLMNKSTALNGSRALHDARVMRSARTCGKLANASKHFILGGRRAPIGCGAQTVIKSWKQKAVCTSMTR